MNLNNLFRNRKRLTAEKRQAIWDADNIPGTPYAICRYCGMLIHESQPWDASHERAWSRWGSNSLSNYAVAHPHCNRSEGNQNMSLVQRLSIRTWIILIALALTLLATVLITNTGHAQTADPPRPTRTSTWETARAITRTSLQVQASFGLRQAKRRGCTLAAASYSNTRFNANVWQLADARWWLRKARTQMRSCRL